MVTPSTKVRTIASITLTDYLLLLLFLGVVYRDYYFRGSLYSLKSAARSGQALVQPSVLASQLGAVPGAYEFLGRQPLMEEAPAAALPAREGDDAAPVLDAAPEPVEPREVSGRDVRGGSRTRTCPPTIADDLE